MGDHIWLPYYEVSWLKAISQYLEGLSIPGIKHLLKKIAHSYQAISVATVDSLLRAHDIIFGLVNCLLLELPRPVEAIGLKGQALKVPCNPSVPLVTPSSSAFPNTMTSTPMIIDDPMLSFEPGELSPPPPHGGSSHRGCGNCRRGGRRGPEFAPLPQGSNNEALHAFTWFFHTEAEVSKKAGHCHKISHTYDQLISLSEELATHKEAHTFDQHICAEQVERHAAHH
jgi:hypothetical protein